MKHYFIRISLALILVFGVTFSMSAQNTSSGYQSGMAKFQAKDYSGAIDDFTKALEEKPENPEAYFARGEAKFNLKSCECGTEDFDMAIQQKPDYADAYAARAIIYDCSKQLDLAKADIDKAFSLDPANALAYAARGYYYTLKNENSKAISDLDVAMRMKPEMKGTLLNYRGLAHMGLNKYQKARRDFTKSLAADATQKDVYLNRADAYMNTGSWKNAIKDYDSYLAINPNNHSVHFAKATVYLDNHKYDKAITEMNVAIAQDPANADYRMMRGLIYANNKDYPNALVDFKSADTIGTGNAGEHKFIVSQQDYLYYYGVTCYACNFNEDAVNNFNKLITLDPQYKAEAYYFKCKAKSKMNDNAGVCEDCQKAYTMGYKSAKKYMKKECQMPARAVGKTSPTTNEVEKLSER